MTFVHNGLLSQHFGGTGVSALCWGVKAIQCHKHRSQGHSSHAASASPGAS